jgi:hypothetical protein
MNINKDNYEAYFLDYFEGNLSTAEVEELFAFMELHPEVKNEFEGFEMITVATDQATVFEDKDLLKKNEILSHTPITINTLKNTWLLNWKDYSLTMNQSSYRNL